MENNRLRFTKARLGALSVHSGARQKFFYDIGARGLCVSVTVTGSITYYVLRKFLGRTERVRIGRFPETTIAQARKRAGEVNSQFDAGLNVNDIKRRDRGEPTLGQAYDEYMERHAKVHNRRPEKSEDMFRWHLSGWVNRRLSTITKEDVNRWHARIGRRIGHHTANNALTLLKAIYNRVIDWDLFQGPNPTNGTTKFKTISRDRYLFPDEIKRFLEALKSKAIEAYRDFFLLLLLTGARKSNVLAMRWRDLNLDTGVWTIPMTKNGEPQRLALNPNTIALLQRRAIDKAINNDKIARIGACHGLKVTDNGQTIVRFDDSYTRRRRCLNFNSEFVFPGQGRTGHLADPRKPWKKLLQRAQVTNFRVHDLRRTHGSYLAASGANHFVISKALGHKDIKTTEIYSRLDLDPIRAASTKATDLMFSGVVGLLRAPPFE